MTLHYTTVLYLTATNFCSLIQITYQRHLIGVPVQAAIKSFGGQTP